MAQVPRIAILGAGIFVRTQYIPRLAEISDLFVLTAIWSRSEVKYFSFCFFICKFYSDSWLFMATHVATWENVEKFYSFCSFMLIDLTKVVLGIGI